MKNIKVYTKLDVAVIKKQAEMINDVEHGYTTKEQFDKDIELFKNMAEKKGIKGDHFESLLCRAVIEASRERQGAKTFIWN